RGWRLSLLRFGAETGNECGADERNSKGTAWPSRDHHGAPSSVNLSRSMCRWDLYTAAKRLEKARLREAGKSAATLDFAAVRGVRQMTPSSRRLKVADFTASCAEWNVCPSTLLACAFEMGRGWPRSGSTALRRLSNRATIRTVMSRNSWRGTFFL